MVIPLPQVEAGVTVDSALRRRVHRLESRRKDHNFGGVQRCRFDLASAARMGASEIGRKV